MSPTTTRAALRRAGVLLVAAALVGVPVSGALAEPTPEPTASATATATAGTPTPSASEEPTPSESPSVEPERHDLPDATASASPTPTDLPSTSSPTPSASAPGPDDVRRPRVSGLSRAQLLAAAGAAAPQTGYAADFIARTLAAGGDHYEYPDFAAFDGGNTIDAMLGLAASGAGATQLAESLAYLEDNVGGYMGADYDSTYAGPTAKAVIGVLAAGGDPTAVGDLDLVAELQATEGAVEPGRFSDLPVDCGFPTCDYSNTIGQSLGVIALVRAGEPLSQASVDFLLDQQCADGGFRGNLDADGLHHRPRRHGLRRPGPRRRRRPPRPADALDWLADAQGPDGALDSDEGTANANTTGVAAQAFAAGGRDAELADAQAFLVTLQYDCTAAAALRGGIAFSEADRSTHARSRTPTCRATGQATVGLAGESLLSAAVELARRRRAPRARPARRARRRRRPRAPTRRRRRPRTSGSDGGETTGPVGLRPRRPRPDRLRPAPPCRARPGPPRRRWPRGRRLAPPGGARLMASAPRSAASSVASPAPPSPRAWSSPGSSRRRARRRPPPARGRSGVTVVVDTGSSSSTPLRVGRPVVGAGRP